jgi:hypothetical protein
MKRRVSWSSPGNILLSSRGKEPSDRLNILKVYFLFIGGDFFVLYSTLLHLPPLRFHCVDGCWDQTQDRCNWCIDSRGALTTGLDLIRARLDLIRTRLDLILKVSTTLVFRFMWVSDKFGICTVVSVTLAEDKMRRIKGECAHFSFKVPNLSLTNT